MRSTRWTLVLLVLVFCIGWTTRVVSEGRGGPAWRERSGPRAWKMTRGGGPLLHTIDQFASELELTDQQELALSAITTRTSDTIRQHEKAIWDTMHQARPHVLEILTEPQRARLDELVDEHWKNRRDQKVSQVIERLRQEGIDTATLDQIETVLAEYEQGKSTVFVSLRERESWPEESELAAEMDRLRTQRNQGLSRYLSAEQMERLDQRPRWSR